MDHPRVERGPPDFQSDEHTTYTSGPKNLSREHLSLALKYFYAIVIAYDKGYLFCVKELSIRFVFIFLAELVRRSYCHTSGILFSELAPLYEQQY